MSLKTGVHDIGYEKMKELVGKPIGEELLEGENRSPHAPKYAYPAVDFIWGKVSELVSDNVVIVDFGEIFEVSHPPETLNIPSSYAGPEWLFEKRTGIGNDLWS